MGLIFPVDHYGLCEVRMYTQYMACNTRKRTFGHLGKLSSWIGLHRLIQNALHDSVRFCAKVELLLTEKLHKMDSVISDRPAQTAQADLK